MSSIGSHRFGARPPEEDPDHGPIELAAVHADDALINAIAHAEHDADPDADPDVDPDVGPDLDEDSDDGGQLAAVLRAWRQDIDSEPLPELVDLEQAADAVAAGSRERSQSRRPRALAVAAAMLVVVVSSLGFAVHAATPGDPLWGVSKVVFSQRAASVQKAEQAATELDQANAALAAGQPDQAQTRLSQAGAQLPGIRAQDGAADLQARHAQLRAQLPAGPPHPTSTATPNRSPAISPASTTTTSTTATSTTATSTTATSTTTAPPTPCGSHRPTSRPAAGCTP